MTPLAGWPNSERLWGPEVMTRQHDSRKWWKEKFGKGVPVQLPENHELSELVNN